MLWFGGHRVDAGQMQIGALTAFLSYLMQILMAVMMATFMAMMIPRAAVCAERIGEVLDTESSVAAAGGARAADAADRAARVARRRVPLPGRGAPVLARHLASPRAPGQTTAIIGSTGAGKTTLLVLIPRLFDVTGGHGARSTASTCASSTPRRCGRGSAGPAAALPVLRHGRVNLRLRRPGRDRRRAVGGARGRAGRATSSRRCRQGSTRRSRRAAPTSPAASASGSRSPGRWCADPRVYLFDDSFSALDFATDARLRAALAPGHRGRDGDHRRAAGRRPSPTPTRSSCSTTARSSARARTTSCSRRARRTPRSSSRSSARRRRHEHRPQGATAAHEDARRRATSRRAPPGAGRQRRPGARAAVGEHGHARGEGDDLRPVGAPAARAGWRPSGLAWSSCSCSASSAWRSRRRAEAARPRDGHHLRRRARQAAARRASRRPRRRPTRAPRATAPSPTLIESAWTSCPAPGIDFAALGRVLLLVVALYVGASLLAWLQGCLLNGVVQRTSPRCAATSRTSCTGCRCGTSTRQPRGELLSRVTNDIDNVAQSLQQTMSQLLDLAAHGGRRARDDVRDLAAARGDRAASPCRCRSW